jgi:hypothetical protein
MIGEGVEHAHFGPGRIVAVYRGGTEWLVRFDSGLTFRRPREEFAGSPGVPAAATGPRYVPPPPMLPSQLEARRLVEALRVGIAPADHVRELTIGLVPERASLAAGLNQALDQGGDVRAVVGEYGFGKSHFVQLAAEEALARNFLVATAGLDIVELPAHRGFDIYAALMRSLRYPDRVDEHDLAALLDASATPRVVEQLREHAPVAGDPFALGLAVMAEMPGRRGRHPWQQWLMGGRKAKGMAKALPRGVKLPTLYATGHNERQLAYLLTAVSALARLAGYSGLAVLIDEAESYSLLRPAQREKAGTFFAALVYAALGERQARIDPAALPEHRHKEYPPRFGDGQSLFFVFTLTHSDNQMPLDDWLAPEQVLTLDPHPSPQEIGQFLQQLQACHARAFGYEPGERQSQVRRSATELLAEGARLDRLSIRGVVRLAVELYDLMLLYPDFDVPLLLDELRRQLK